MQQWIRKCTLIVSNGGSGVDLSQLRITFTVEKTENETPNHAQIKIYNLAKGTENQIINEFTRVILQAGYQENFGVIFDGEIVQSKRGRENGTDNYVIIDASDGDSAYNYAIVNTTLAAGSSQSDHINAAAGAMGVDKGSVNPNGGTLGTHDVLPNQAVLLNSKSGLIGGAEQSTKGIKVKALLNSMLHIGAKVIVNEADIALAKIAKTEPSDTANKPATIAHDGAYKIIGASFVGDTFGNDWYSEIICIDIDESAPKKKAKAT
jgi:archaellin